MTMSEARSSADYLLTLIIKHQPNLLTNASGVHITDGAGLAAFCEEFVVAHAKNLIKNDQQGS